MREHLSGTSVANSIRMTRSQFAGVFVLVEGAGSDARFYRRVVDERGARLIPAHSKSNVIGAIRMLDDDQVQGALGIVDADRDRLLGRPLQSPNIFRTDSAWQDRHSPFRFLSETLCDWRMFARNENSHHVAES